MKSVLRSSSAMNSGSARVRRPSIWFLQALAAALLTALPSWNALASTTFYVATNGSDAANGLTWDAAKQTIQSAVNLTQAGDSVLVSNGVYATGGGIAPTLSGSNRVVVTNNITVQSVNGAAVTFIKGLNGGTYSFGDSVRCVYMKNGGTLSGFTMTNGCTASGSYDDCGGGINFGAFAGGGSAGTGGTARNCVITGCAAKWGGGGAIYGTLINCLVTGNTSPNTAGGAYAVNMVNCTVAGNSAGASDGGTCSGTLNNCIVYANSAPSNPNRDGICVFSNSCTTPAPGSGTGNITSDPQFVNAAAGNFHLQDSSPCIDKGGNGYVTTNMTTDLDGNPRVINGTVDMGAYEWTTVTVTVAAIGSGTVTGSGSYQVGSSIGISATATGSRWFFSQWNDGNTSASRTIIVPLTNITYTATFTQSTVVLTFYVATNGSDAADGLTWATAKQTIQSGVDQTLAGDTVLVSNGVYATGGRVTPGLSLMCRVGIPSSVTVRSVNGAAWTTIAGAINSTLATNGDAAVRCVFLRGNAILSGFTVTNGHTRGSSGDATYEKRGGGVYCEETSATVNNCILTGCSAYNWGGGAEGGTFYNCLFVGNWAGESSNGGGGGADSSMLNNCTLYGNRGLTSGGGAQGGSLNNCIVYANSAPTYPNRSDSCVVNNSCTTPAPGSGTGNITSDPQFVNAAAGNFHLQGSSPCIGTGGNGYVTTNMTTDLDGNPRVINGTVDMGAYEWTTVTVTVAAIGSGTVTGSGSYQVGSSIGISATATGSRWFFSQWNDGNTSASRTIIVPLTNITYTATFTQSVALTFCVATNGSDAASGLTWATAKQTIQAAVNLTQAGDSVLVSNGVYATGGGIAPTLSGSNRVVVTNNITVQSVNGAAVTFIKGLNGGTYSFGDSVRCVYMKNGGTLSGFTLTNGCTASGICDDCGGGINFGAYYGVGGSAGTGGTARNCVITGCAAWGGGGAIYGTLINCLVTGNTTVYTAGGGYAVNMVNCTVAGNSAGETDGGTCGGTLNNCIVYANSAPSDPNRDDTCVFNNSCTTPAPGSGTGNITSDPLFLNVFAGNFRLAYMSPCVNSGNNAYASGTDLDGNPRINNGTVDMGAYEVMISTVTLTAIGGGTVTGGGSYPAGSSIDISATATSGHWFFSQWNDGNTSASRTIIVPLTNITYTATFTQNVGALTFYVATNGSDAADGYTWATAKQTIQGGVDQTLAGDTVLVSNGVYATGTRVTPGWNLMCRVVIPSSITVRSVNGAAWTTIAGAINSTSVTNGDAAVRCVYFGDNAVLSGFTLTNGHTRGSSGDATYEQRGGAVFCNTMGAVVSNCVVTGCSGQSWGGGAEGCTFYNCLFTGNWSGQGGGGADNSSLINCTVSGNTGPSGGGAAVCALNNSIVYFNFGSGTSSNCYTFQSVNNCCTTPMPGYGTSNIVSDPQFINPFAGNFRIRDTSPCRGQGSTTYLSNGVDLDGYPRVVNGSIDMGAYENTSGATYYLRANSGSGGYITLITPTTPYVTAGGSAVFFVEANACYRIATLTTNGVSVGAFGNDSTSTNFTWSNVQATGTLYASFTDQVTSDPGHPTYKWLVANGLLTDTNCTNGSCSDTDHDGMTAWQEYLAGTDPTSASSVLSFRSIASTNGSSVLQWSSSASARAPYNVLYSTNLASGVWTLYTNNIAATPPTNTLVVPSLGNNVELFYKVTITN